MPALKSTLFGFLLLLLITSASDAQLRFGVILDEEQTESLSASDLNNFSSNGINLISPSGLVSTSLITDTLRVMPSLPFSYLTPGSRMLRENAANQIIRSFRTHYYESGSFSTESIITGLHPDLRSSRVRSFYENVRSSFAGENLYIITDMVDVLPDGFTAIAYAGISAEQTSGTGDIMLLSSHRNPNGVRAYYDEIKAAAVSGFSTLLIRYDDYIWLTEQDEFGSEMLYAFSNQLAGSATVPLPALQPETPSIRLDVIILLLLWLSFSIHFRFNPNYNRSVIRYFASYSFMVEDILRRHIIMGGSALVVFVQISVLWGLVLSSAFTGLFGTAGHEAFGYHYSFIPGTWGVFAIGAVAGTLFNAVGLIWLMSTCFRQDIFSMASTFFLWPMHIGFVLATILVTVAVLMPGSIIIVVLCFVFLLLNYVAFYLASSALGSEPTLSPAIHFLTAPALYTFVTVLLGYLVYTYTDLFNVLMLSFRLS
ncbi:MAG: hypothetical protein LAT84_09580 [Balneolia bacterium]|nr:hypothetical protein [Balneolia bacterium]